MEAPQTREDTVLESYYFSWVQTQTPVGKILKGYVS